jgi:hypothetical protein
MLKYDIKPIKNYPDNGKHLECNIGLPFKIRKGEDGYVYYDKNGKEKLYGYKKIKNNYIHKTDDRWIAHINGNRLGYNNSLIEIFEIQVNKDLDKIVDYCFKTYEKSLNLELLKLKKLKTEFEIHDKVIGVICLSVEDFLSWKKEQGHNPEFDTRRKYKYEDNTYICITNWQNSTGLVFDGIIETKYAQENPEYELIKNIILKTNKIFC